MSTCNIPGKHGCANILDNYWLQRDRVRGVWRVLRGTGLDFKAVLGEVRGAYEEAFAARYDMLVASGDLVPQAEALLYS